MSYSATYIYPTPEDNSRISSSNITFKVQFFEAVSGCNLTINSIVYSMSKSGDFCTRTLSNLTSIAKYTFNVSYSTGSVNYMSTRTFTLYPTLDEISEVPAYGFFSFITFFFTIIFFWRRQNE